MALFLAGCGDDWDVGPDGGHVVSRRFSYYYSEACDYDAVGPYNCEGAKSMSPYMLVSLRIDVDGMATLTIDGEPFMYWPSEYYDGYDSDYGDYYYQFYEGGEEITLYRDGFEMIFVDRVRGEAIYYYADLPF